MMSENMALTNESRSFPPPFTEETSSLLLTIRCYKAVIKDLCEAKILHQKQDIDATYDKIRHAQDVITELLVSLDYERGGEIAQNLSRLYNFILRQLIGINNREDTETYDHLIRLLSELESAWEQLSLNQR